MFNIPEGILQFGFPAVVVVILLWVLHSMINRHGVERAAQDKLNQEFAKEILKAHAAERSEWQRLNSEDRRAFTDAVKSLESVIHMKTGGG